MSDYSDQSNTLDSGQAIKAAYDKTLVAHRVIALNALIPEQFDEISLTYIVAGNGTGQVGVVTYKLATVSVAILSLTYDNYGGIGASSNRLVDVVKL